MVPPLVIIMLVAWWGRSLLNIVHVLFLASIVAIIIGIQDNLLQWYFLLVLRYQLIETLSRLHIEMWQWAIPGDGHQLACRQSIDCSCNFGDMIVALIGIISIIFSGLNPLRCWFSVRLICNVNPAHDFTRRYRHHGPCTLIILRAGMFSSSCWFQQHFDMICVFYHSMLGANLRTVYNIHWRTFECLL